MRLTRSHALHDPLFGMLSVDEGMCACLPSEQEGDESGGSVSVGLAVAWYQSHTATQTHPASCEEGEKRKKREEEEDDDERCSGCA